jgi:hypothetical protein
MSAETPQPERPRFLQIPQIDSSDLDQIISLRDHEILKDPERFKRELKLLESYLINMYASSDLSGDREGVMALLQSLPSLVALTAEDLTRGVKMQQVFSQAEIEFLIQAHESVMEFVHSYRDSPSWR